MHNGYFWERTDKWKKSISDGIKRKYPDGKPAWNKGKKMPSLSEQHKQKISVALIGHEGPRKGQKQSLEERMIRKKSAFLRWQKQREKHFRKHPEQLLKELFKGDKSRMPKKIAWNKGLKKIKEKNSCKICGKPTERIFCGYSCSAKLREQKHKENGMTDKLAKKHSKFMKKYANKPENIERSRKSGHETLRKIALKKRTRIEQFMENALIKYEVNFIPESVVYVKGKIRYRVDFELPDEKVFVECDGKHWHQDLKKDKIRENIILSQLQYKNYKFERFWGTEIYKDVNKCVEEILNTHKKEV